MDALEATQKFKDADTLFKQGEYVEALIVLNQLNREYPNMKNVLYPMALCFDRLGRPGDVRRLCERLILDFDDPRAKALLDSFETPPGPEPTPARGPASTPVPHAVPDFDSRIRAKTPAPVVAKQADIGLYLGVGGLIVLAIGLLIYRLYCL
jgi:hypothetical protein